MKFLCVDDSATLRKLISMALAGGGHTVFEAEDGRKGLDKLAADTVDCIILDINMPEMNGIDFLKERAKNASWAKIPVIVLTTEAEEEMKATALSLGAKGFLAKPFQKDELLAAIKQTTGA
jgi:two-component system chemotaxis response regulator CheY